LRITILPYGRFGVQNGIVRHTLLHHLRFEESGYRGGILSNQASIVVKEEEG